MDREVLRQLLHIVSIVLIVPLLFIEQSRLITIFAGVILLIVLTMEHIRRLNKRAGLLRQAVLELKLIEETDRQVLLRNIERLKRANEEIIQKYIQPAIRPEEWPGWASLTFLLGLLITMMLFGKEIAALMIIPLALGDGLATIVGTRWGKHKIPPFRVKSFEGSLAFFLVTLIGVFIFLQFIPLFSNILWMTIIIAGASTIIEAMPELNDNMSVPVFTGVLIFLVTHFGIVV